jgi:hypothetical protein
MPISSRDVPNPAGGSLLFYSYLGAPTLTTISGTGKIGTPTAAPSVPALGNQGAPIAVTFLPNGASIVTWSVGNFGDYMGYRSAKGQIGAPVRLPDGFASLAVRKSEILTSEGGGTGVTVTSFKLSSAGAIGQGSSPVNVFTGQPIFNSSWITVDSSGSAVVVVNGSTDNEDTEQVFTTDRTAKGVWGAQHQLNATGGSVEKVSFGASPGGRAILDWVNAPTNTAATMSASIHLPGKGFGAPITIGSVSSSGGAFILQSAAAGADGTLAVGETKRVYNSGGIVFTTQNSVRIAAPAATTLGGPVAVPGSNSTFGISSLGAGDSQAVVGDVQQTYGDPDNAGTYHESQFTSASILKAAAAPVSQTFGSSSGNYNGNGSSGCGCPQQPPTLSVTGVALDNNGLATAVGQLKPGGVLSYAVRAGKAPTPKPRLSVTTKLVATSTHVSDKLACAVSTCKGTLTLSAKVGQKTETLAETSYTIKPGKHQSVSAKLTAAGKKALKHAKAHHVKATLVVTVTHATTITKHVTVS